ncbi:hypothetical protein F4806DRAFT_293299 [Annulohypoxylon nitens]|nr:hypothetical protein F4806DRAFT_293299 [Annulohypoxylon nitens]
MYLLPLFHCFWILLPLLSNPIPNLVVPLFPCLRLSYLHLRLCRDRTLGHCLWGRRLEIHTHHLFFFFNLVIPYSSSISHNTKYQYYLAMFGIRSTLFKSHYMFMTYDLVLILSAFGVAVSSISQWSHSQQQCRSP